MPHAIFASQDSLYNLYHGLMPLRRLRGCGSFLVRGGHIREQVACVLLVDDLQIVNASSNNSQIPRAAMPAALS